MKFLHKLKNSTPGVGKAIEYEAPSDRLIQAYVFYMSDSTDKKVGKYYGRGNVYNSVRTRIGAVSGTNREFSGSDLALIVRL